MKKLIEALSVGLFLFILGCYVEHTVPVQPTAAVVERTEPPFTGAVWIDNEYRWDNSTYVVVPAHWERAQGVWVPGHWKKTSRGYTWVAGHWK